jgi:hypothetical protein
MTSGMSAATNAEHMLPDGGMGDDASGAQKINDLNKSHQVRIDSN